MKTKRFKDLSGQIFSELKVLSFVEFDSSGGAVWLCKCMACGSETKKRKHPLVSGKSKSCGCKKRGLPQSDPRRFHGMTNTKFYGVWVAMLSRCYDEKKVAYKDYGGRGIMVCERWQQFQNFYEDMYASYQEGLTLDRYPNPNGNYEPSNCRWATFLQQNRNRRNSRKVIFENEEMAITELAARNNMRYDTLLRRIDSGWPIKEAISIPPSQKNAKIKFTFL